MNCTTHKALIPLSWWIIQYFVLLICFYPLQCTFLRRKERGMRKKQRSTTALWKNFWICQQRRRSHSYKRYLSLSELSDRYVQTWQQSYGNELFSLRIPILVFVFGAMGNSLTAKPVRPCEFPLTCLAATVFLACLERKCVFICTVIPRSTLVAVVCGITHAAVPWDENFKLWRI